MSWKFNPPPGWPEQPEGWQPPPGWAPDPSWPPAPPGWQFWVPATPAPAPASPGPTVHDAPTSLANPTVPVPASPAGSYEPAPPYSPGAPQSPPAAPSPAGSYPPPGPFPPASGPSYQPAGAFPPPGGPQQPAPPAAPAGGGTPWYQQWWAIGGTALLVLLVGCVGGGTVAVLTDTEDDPPNPPQTTAPPPATTGPQPTENPNPNPGGGDTLGPGEEQTGEGPTIIPIDLSGGSDYTVSLEYEGEGYFSSTLVDEAGDVVIYLGSTEFGQTGYSGVWPLSHGLTGYNEPAAIDITNAESGTWTVRIQDFSESPAWPEVTEGVGDSVLRIDPGAVSDPAILNATHDGESNFIVWAYSGEEDYNDLLLFNLIGAVDDAAERELTSSQVVMHVQADGSWTITPP